VRVRAARRFLEEGQRRTPRSRAIRLGALRPGSPISPSWSERHHSRAGRCLRFWRAGAPRGAMTRCLRLPCAKRERRALSARPLFSLPQVGSAAGRGATFCRSLRRVLRRRRP
jgi:hypothetical protein